MPTRADVIAHALRRIGVLAEDETMTADQENYCGTALDALFAEFQAVQGATFAWALSATPAAALLPLSGILAAEVAEHYGRQFGPRSRYVASLRAYAFSDDRENSKDLDGDLTVTESEAYAAGEGEFF